MIWSNNRMAPNNLFPQPQERCMPLINLGSYPIAFLMAGLLIPLIYSAAWKRRELKSMALLFACGILMVILYPLTSYLSVFMGRGGYPLAKLIIFVLLPIGAIYYIEGWKVGDILSRTGVGRENLGKSIIYGLGAAVVTITITFLLSTASGVDLIWSAITFFESFTEEFFFRGVLLLYLMKKTNLKIAYVTSVISFIIVHPQNFSNLFLLSTTAQGILMGIVAYRTRNIIGPWIGHGLNRILPAMIRAAIGA